MITKVQGKNWAEYEELFRAAEKQLQLAPNSIDSIHTYLDKISDMHVRMDANNYNLLRLPVTADEPLFTIDANTREIKVPKDFKENGLTIKGDKLAEIVYFKMDRFFDMMDLYRFANEGTQTTNVHQGPHTYIEWYNPSAKDPEYQQGVDFAYAMTCDDNYIYFGWPLADKVAGESGNIQFTVRFLEIDDDEIVYNYSTKIATCEIKNTLNFDLKDGDIIADSWESLLYNRAIYSSVVNSTESPAAILLKGIDSAIIDMNTREVEVPVEDGEEGETETVTEYYYDIPVVATISVASKDPETHETLDQNLTFLWYQDDSLVPASVESAHVVTGAPTGELAEYAVDPNAKASVFTANKVGRYTVWIGNKIQGKNNTRYIYTGTITIPRPENVIASNEGIIEHGYVGQVTLYADISNTVPHRDLVYSWYKEGQAERIADTSSFTPDDEGVYYVEIQNRRNNEITDVTSAARSRMADIRMEPQTITSLTLEYDNSGKYFTARVVHQYEGHKIHYTWYRMDENGTTTIVNDHETGDIVDQWQPDLPGRYFVNAREIVFDEDPILRREATLDQRARSNEITLNSQMVAVETA